jgi:hypothetical protein
MRKLLAGLVLSGTLLAALVPTVAAHECFIVNRSEQGAVGADHSGRWDMLPLGAIFGFIHGVVGGPALSPAQIEWAVGEAANQGLPAEGWLVRSDRTIGSGPRLADGKGLDHLADVYGEQIVGIYFQALAH